MLRLCRKVIDKTVKLSISNFLSHTLAAFFCLTSCLETNPLGNFQKFYATQAHT
jgi:hypothetical protein